MPDESATDHRTALVRALATAHSDGRLDAAPLQDPVRAFARARREAGVGIAECLLEVKQMIAEETGRDAPVFTPQVVGWAVRGYFDGTSRRDFDRGTP